MDELIQRLRSLAEDNKESGQIPLILLNHVLSDAEAKLEYRYAARRIAGGILGEIWQMGGIGYEQKKFAEDWITEHPGEFELIRQSHIQEQWGAWEKA